MQEREILFRGKDIKGNWHIGLLARIGNAWYISNKSGVATGFEVIPDTVGQYTGLTDKNGVKIFEGDIVSNEWCFICGNSVVKFGEYQILDMSKDYQQGHYGFYLEHLDPTEKAVTRKDMMYFANNCVVIGNIHDNPELIKE